MTNVGCGELNPNRPPKGTPEGGLTIPRVTLRQIAKTINLLADSEIDSVQYQILLESGRFSELLREFMVQADHPEPTITPISFDCNYRQTLVQARDAMELNGTVAQELNDDNFPPEYRDGNREFVLVCFHRAIGDHEEPEKSELMKELDRLGLESEGPMELCFIGADERNRHFQWKFPIVARRQIWRNPHGDVGCPVLVGYHGRWCLSLDDIVHDRWHEYYRFLCSRK